MKRFNILLLALFAFSLISACKPVPNYEGYLFAYFEGQGAPGEQEQLRFAISEGAVQKNPSLKNGEGLQKLPNHNYSDHL
ncbi:hypothetical protein ACFSKL_00810 [Belliella marina]|uniref:Lipoprotein n=1 Tax=Belliella marina TaxID=1644146 RepID=A0ABW4VGY1_9BACT